MKLKILFVHNYYRLPGGERTFLDAQIDLLRARGHKVVIYKKDSALIDSYNIFQKIGLFFNSFFSIKSYREIRELIKIEKPNIAHISNVFPLISPSVYWALKVDDIPIVQSIHNYRLIPVVNKLLFTNTEEYFIWFINLFRGKFGSYKIHNIIYKFIVQLHSMLGTYGNINAYIFPSRFVKNVYCKTLRIPNNKVFIIENFLSLPSLVNMPKRKSGKYVLFLGRVASGKGVRVLIKAIDLLKGVNVKIAGTGPQLNNIINFCKLHNIKCVEFLGYVQGGEKWQLIKNAYVVVVPSIWFEPFGYSAIESMVAGAPVIASRIGALPEIVEHKKTGLLFNPGNEKSLAKKLNYILTHRKLRNRLGIQARKIVKQKYSASSQYKKFLVMYKCIVG